MQDPFIILALLFAGTFGQFSGSTEIRDSSTEGVCTVAEV